MTVHTHPYQTTGTQITNGRTTGRFIPKSSQRIDFARTERVTPQTQLVAEPTPHWTTGDVWQAFHGYAIARLAEGRYETRTYRHAAAHFWVDQLHGRGLSDEQIARFQYGLVPSLTEARDYLRSLGFSDYDVDQSGLPYAISAAAGGHRDVLCVPFVGLPGQPGGLALLSRGGQWGDYQSVSHGAITHDASHVAYDHVVLTTDPVEATLLRDAGLAETYTVPTSAAAATSFWESLADHGVDRATFVTTASHFEWDSLRHAAEFARTARVTPAVDLFELPQSSGQAISTYCRTIGVEAFRAELERRYETPAPAAPAHVAPAYTQPTPVKTFDAVTYWAAVRPEIASIKDPHQRRHHERLASEVAQLLATDHFGDASRVIDAAITGTGSTWLPQSTSHHVEYVRSASARDAMAKRLFDVLRTTTGHVTVVTPLAHDEFLEQAARHAAGQTSDYGATFARRDAQTLRAELQTFGHRLRVISTPQPFALGETANPLLNHTDLILVDATGEASTFWWQENGWASRLTEMAETADCDLVAFWAVDRPAKTTTYRPELISVLRRFSREGYVTA